MANARCTDGVRQCALEWSCSGLFHRCIDRCTDSATSSWFLWQMTHCFLLPSVPCLVFCRPPSSPQHGMITPASSIPPRFHPDSTPIPPRFDLDSTAGAAWHTVGESSVQIRESRILHDHTTRYSSSSGSARWETLAPIVRLAPTTLRGHARTREDTRGRRDAWQGGQHLVVRHHGPAVAHSSRRLMSERIGQRTSPLARQ
jgi:hypothetical protein